MGQCSVCTRPISGGDVLYTGDGNLICPQCHAQKDLEQADLKAAKNITNSAVSCLLFALFSYIINPYFIITVLSVSSGLYALKSLAPSNERFAKHVQSKRVLIIFGAIVGLGISGINVLLFFLQFSSMGR